MSRSRRRFVQLSIAGTVTLPPIFPEIGLISISGTEWDAAFLYVERFLSPAQIDRYIVRLADVSAVLIAEDGQVDPQRGPWLLGREIEQLLKRGGRDEKKDGDDGDDEIYGIAFVRENVGVIVQTDRGMAAGEIPDTAKTCEEDCASLGCEDCSYGGCEEC